MVDRPPIRLLLAGLLVLAALGTALLLRGGDDERSAGTGAPGPEAPPPAQVLRRDFLGAQEDYAAARDLLLALPWPNATVQTDYLAWNGHRRTEMERGHWWAPDDTWVDTPTALAEMGLDAERFGRLRTFLEAHDLLAVQKIGPHAHGEAEVAFLPAQGAADVRWRRVVVWHAGREAQAAETRYWVAEGETYPQHMRESPLPTAGWFLRETVVDWPRRPAQGE